MDLALFDGEVILLENGRKIMFSMWSRGAHCRLYANFIDCDSTGKEIERGTIGFFDMLNEGIPNNDHMINIIPHMSQHKDNQEKKRREREVREYEKILSRMSDRHDYIAHCLRKWATRIEISTDELEAWWLLYGTNGDKDKIPLSGDKYAMFFNFVDEYNSHQPMIHIFLPAYRVKSVQS